MNTTTTRMERKKDETRRRICTAAMKRFQEQGVDATTMEQIAVDADVAKGTLYSYFPVKEAIIHEYMQRSFRGKREERHQRFCSMPDTRTRMRSAFSELMAGVLEHQDLFQKYILYCMQQMVSFGRDEGEKSGLFRVALDIIELGQQDGEIQKDIPLFLLEDMVEFAFMEVVKWLFISPETFHTEEAIERSIDLFLHGAGIQPA